MSFVYRMRYSLSTACKLWSNSRLAPKTVLWRRPPIRQWFVAASFLGRQSLLAAPVTLYGFALAVHAKSDAKKELLDEADRLYGENKFAKVLELLKQQDGWNDDYELLWRVGRCNYQLSKTDSKKKVELLKVAYDNIKRALELNKDCGPAHKWAAILLDAVSALDGTKSRIQQTLNVREHMEEAIRLMPDDATASYVLGEWHYTLSTTSWMEKQIAAAIFAKLPEASLEDALENFEIAEKKEPGFYSKNLVLLAKTLIALNKDRDRTIEILKSVVKQHAKSDRWDDQEAVKEARDILWRTFGQ